VSHSIIRDRFTWLAYLLLGLFAFFSNSLGPAMPFLKDELQLSYTLSSLHFSAFAAGILLIGFCGPLFITHSRRLSILWLGAAGMSAGAFLFILANNPAQSVAAAFLMGFAGGLALAVVPAALSEHRGAMGPSVLTEANAAASLVGTAAPLLVGWFALAMGSWRLALGCMALAPIGMRLGLGKISLDTATPKKESMDTDRSLPLLYWYFWTIIVLSEAVEYCMIFWSPDYLEHQLGMPKPLAALAASLFLVAMIVGRLAVSRLVQHIAPRRVVIGSILLALCGFTLFWMASAPAWGVAGLFLTGLGVASLYPLTLAMAIAAAPGCTVRASTRAALSTGSSILVLPLLLGWLADLAGIHSAMVLIAILLAGALLLTTISTRLALATS
jgi:MFS family permease